MATLVARRPPHGDVTKIPTPPLQAAGLFINFFFPALAFVIVCLRAYARIRIKQWGVDDYFMIAAMLFSLLMCGPFYIHIKLNYYGWLAADVPADYDPSPGRWWFYLAQIFYNPVLALVKASVLVFLLRLGGQKPRVRYAIYALFTFNALQAIAIFLVATLQCLPIAANWDPAVMATATCVDNSFHVTISSLTILTDILVLALPFWIFLGLNMPVASKVGVIGVFLLGISVPIVAIVRLVELIKLFYYPNPTADPFHSIGITLSAVEVNVAIISASIPALYPILRVWMPGIFGSSTAKYSYGYNRYGGSMPGGGHSGVPRQGGMGTGAGSSSNVGGGSFYRGESRGGGMGVGMGIGMKNMRGVPRHVSDCRSQSPSGSEEDMIAYHGILKSTDVRVKFDGGDEDCQSMSRLSGISGDGEGGVKGAPKTVL
ncbi:hypothetical protein FQN50_003562 [Emmonsiellopsis sp. PD_5]|nr:hypothetical protein FQN50_003562 [Emmonsiellopsis sp. PD_5]